VQATLNGMACADDRRVVEAFARWWLLPRYPAPDPAGGGFVARARAPSPPGRSGVPRLAARPRGKPGGLHPGPRRALAGGTPDTATGEGLPPVGVSPAPRHGPRRRPAPDPLPARSPDADRLLVVARQFAIDATLPLVDRVAGLLLLCYGQTLTRLVRLRTGDLVGGVEGVSIRFGRTELVLAQGIGTLVTELAGRPGRRATTGAPTTARGCSPAPNRAVRWGRTPWACGSPRMGSMPAPPAARSSWTSAPSWRPSSSPTSSARIRAPRSGGRRQEAGRGPGMPRRRHEAGALPPPARRRARHADGGEFGHAEDKPSRRQAMCLARA
jgi:hypothetical protein